MLVILIRMGSIILDENDSEPPKTPAKPENKSKKDEKNDEPQLSEEDKLLQSTLHDSVDILCAPDTKTDIAGRAIATISNEVKSSTGSMTSVPKPLKFLKPKYEDLLTFYNKITDEDPNKINAGRLVSALSMTMGEEGSVLSIRLEVQKLEKKKEHEALSTWGHEYVRSLTGSVGVEWGKRIEDAKPTDDLTPLVEEMVEYYLSKSGESAAVDLLVETGGVGSLEKMLEGKKVDNVNRLTLYLIKTSDYIDDPERSEILGTAERLFEKEGLYNDSLRVALKRGAGEERVKELFEKAAEDTTLCKQMACLLGRERYNFDAEDVLSDKFDDDLKETLNNLIGNENKSEFFLNLGRDLDVVEAKTPEDIYKSHLSETAGFKRGGEKVQVDSARGNLASTFVNGLVNAGFCSDKLLTVEDADWLYKNKEHGMLSATASIGSIMMWNVEEGLTTIDKYLYSNEEMVKAGACLGVGILCSGVRNEADPAMALLQEHCEGSNGVMRNASVEGLGIAYAGSGREEVGDILKAVIEDEKAEMTLVGLAGLSLGHVFVKGLEGAEEAGACIVQKLMEASDNDLDNAHAKLLCLGLGLLFLGKGAQADAMIEACKTIEHKIGKFAINTISSCAYAGSGNVLKVQEMLHECAEHIEEGENAAHQAVAAIGVALITMGEEVGSEMALRAFDHLLHYCELPIKRAVPLALALSNVSTADYTIIDQLSRLSHHEDEQISQNAIIGLGIVSAGTNNSRVAGLLRGLSDFYNKEAGHMFCVRVAQGFLHMGKGLIGINPWHSDGLLMNGPAVGGILAATLLDKTHYILFYLTSAMNPRMLVTVDEEMEWKPTTVRVGQKVDTVGAPGKPKTITGFQTHTSPVLLSVKERAELGTEEFLQVSSVLEGTVIVKKNPDWEQPEPEEKKK
ncbi:hypothetical protein TL16_g09926 [Triparma laevis f. inornata]|uniref:26S proteasome non-ATPase regulatory subunit 2 homolog n=1 Tax=Triparma laevis f. inornata TaxID=1714386 RepID=A0A9W7EP53_9STRA|nr:hypothetical protein TL16_g09926 [Triparma laevis f. inornata]